MIVAAIALAVTSAGAPTPAPRPALPPADGQPAVEIPVGEDLVRQIIARDQALFDLQFGFSCDVQAMRAFVTDDMEFYHDHEGFAVNSGDQWAADYGKFCKKRRSDNERARRELVRATLVVSRLPNYGAVQSGQHRFYLKQNDGTEKLVGRARFAHLWRLGTDGIWRLARDFSFDHR